MIEAGRATTAEQVTVTIRAAPQEGGLLVPPCSGRGG